MIDLLNYFTVCINVYWQIEDLLLLPFASSSSGYEICLSKHLCLQGMAIAARSQGKHKQRIWVNISLTGIKIVDEKTGVSTKFVNTVIFFKYINWIFLYVWNFVLTELFFTLR